MKIAIIGLGHVAMANALALARAHQVVMTGPLPDRIDAINRGTYGLNDPALHDYCQQHKLDLCAVSDTGQAIDGAEMVFVCTPRSNDPAMSAANMAELDSRIEFVARRAAMAPIVVRSAVPVGYCEAKRLELKGAKIVYAPEFWREGHMLSDMLYPNFLIVGDRYALGRRVLEVLSGAALRSDIPTRQMGLTEAELIRHLSVQLQAARISYFNELDSYALHYGLNARQIIDGVCLDPRIGTHSNNPCFGFAHRGLQRSCQNLQPYLDPARTPLLAALEQADCARIDMLVANITDQKPDAVCLYNPDMTKPLPPAMARIKQKLEGAGISTHVNDGRVPGLDAITAGTAIILAQRAVPELAKLDAKLFVRDHFASGAVPGSPQ